MSESSNVFSLDYQVQLCGLMVRDNNFLAVNHTLVKPEYFKNYYIRTILRKIYEYYIEYKKPPTKDILSTLVNELLKREKLDEEIIYLYKVRIEEIYTKELTDADFIRKSAVTFCKKQEYIKFIDWSYRQINSYEKDFEDISNLEADNKLLASIDSQFLDLMSKGYNKDLGISFAKALGDISELLKSESTVMRVPSGLPSLNAVMGGGYRKGGLYSWVSPPGVGKTTILVSESCHAIRKGYSVVYFTFEMTEPEIYLRFVANLFNLTEQEMSDPRILQPRILEFEALYSPSLVIKHYNEYEANSNTLSSFCRQIELVSNRTVDFMAVDYADYLAPLKGLTDFMYEDKGNTYKDLKKSAVNLYIPVLTASQTKVDGFSAELIGMQHVEGSSMKAHIVDGMFSLNPKIRPEHEVEEGLMPRIIVNECKLRKRVGYGPTTTTCRADYSRTKIYEDSY